MDSGADNAAPYEVTDHLEYFNDFAAGGYDLGDITFVNCAPRSPLEPHGPADSCAPSLCCSRLLARTRNLKQMSPPSTTRAST